MKKHFLIIVLFISVTSFAQVVKSDSIVVPPAFQQGEWLKFKMSYSNFLNAGYSTIEVRDTVNKGVEAFHIIGHGRSTGLVGLFFKVRDTYQTYMYKESLKPFLFKRNVNEGGHTKNKEIIFD